jgi:hypothetical protein
MIATEVTASTDMILRLSYVIHVYHDLEQLIKGEFRRIQRPAGASPCRHPARRHGSPWCLYVTHVYDPSPIRGNLNASTGGGSTSALYGNHVSRPLSERGRLAAARRAEGLFARFVSDWLRHAARRPIPLTAIRDSRITPSPAKKKISTGRGAALESVCKS